MTGGEDEPEEVVLERIVDRSGEVGVLRGAAFRLELTRELARLALVHLGPADAVDRPVLGGTHEPGARIVRDA